MKCVSRITTLTCAAVWVATVVFAQAVRGIVVDQTGLPLVGASLQLLDGQTVVTTAVAAGDGTFRFDAGLPGDTIVAALDGFEPMRVERTEAPHIVLSIARATDTATVVAPLATEASPAATLLGTTLTATNIARLPSSRMRARESLPLLPSVIRGSDGLMRLGGAAAHDTPLLLDGFNVTDPATGLSSLNLPFENVRGVNVLRDPMSVTYGGLLGGIVAMESAVGGDHFASGLQGFVPRPRLSTPEFGRIEGIFPRAYASGSAAGGRVHYATGIEYDYERIPVPGVPSDNGSDVIEDSVVVFTRVDAQLSARHNVTVEAFAFPSRTRDFGLSPRREAAATTDSSGRDLFLGVTHRFLANQKSVLTLKVGAFGHTAAITPNGAGGSLLNPGGWTNNWFASSHRVAVRYTVAAAWERITTIAGRAHDFTVSGEAGTTRMRGTVAESDVTVTDEQDRIVRQVDFSAPVIPIRASDWPLGVALRDVWHATDRLQLDGGVRLDRSRYGGTTPTARLGARYELNEATVLKGGYGAFTGSLPLAVPSYEGYATRTDRRYDPSTGTLLSAVTLAPTLGELRLPRATALTVGLERQLRPRLDAQVSVTARQSSRLATLRVPVDSGQLRVESTGSARYRELQLALRRTWDREQQLFVSYVRSSSVGEVNDFNAVFRALSVPLVQPGGQSRMATDAPNRVLVWGTFNLPREVVVSPVTEWRSGFPYSTLDRRYLYTDSPNNRDYPAFFSVDAVVYKTFTMWNRSADVGMQIFNLTNHRNPRDVYAVVNAPRYGEFTNSVGTILRGYMMLKW